MIFVMLREYIGKACRMRDDDASPPIQQIDRFINYFLMVNEVMEAFIEHYHIKAATPASYGIIVLQIVRMNELVLRKALSRHFDHFQAQIQAFVLTK